MFSAVSLKLSLSANSPWILVALLFCALGADSSKAFAQDKPINFPENQEVPLPGPDTGTETVTLWQLPDEYKAILETDSGELYGIYYSTWSNPKDDNPGVSATQWVEDANATNVPWAGNGNAKLAQELSIKYFEQKGSLMESACDQNVNGSNTSCVDGVQNLYLYGYWNGGGFASWKGDTSAQARPNNDGQNKYQINYYWNGNLFTTPKTGDDLRIQAFAGCKLSEQETISAGKTVLTTAFPAPENNCKKGVASVFEGGTLQAVEETLDLDENFAVRYGVSDQQSDIGGTVDNNSLDLTFTGRFDSVGDGANGKLTFTGSGSSTIRNQAELRGDLAVVQGSLTITTPSSLSGQANPDVGNLRLISTPLIFEDGNNNISVKSGAFLRVAGDDLKDGVGPRTPENRDLPINGDGNRRSPVISLGDGDDNLNIEAGGLLVASYVGMLPSEYDLYKNNCKEGSDPSTCYRAIPQIDFGNGNDTIINDGVIAGPAESPTGNYLEIHLRGGNDKVINNGYLGCLTGGADNGGWNGFKGANTCHAAASGLPVSNDLNRNYNVNFQFEGGNDIYENYGYQRGAVNMAGGDDSLTSTGGIRGSITMGAGNDILKIEANDSWNGSGVVDDWINLGNSRLTDSSSASDTNQLSLVGDAVISFRNSLGFNSDQCGTKSGSSGGYGCRWRDNASGDYGYNYLAVSGSQGRDQIVVSHDSVAGTSSTLQTDQGAQIWGSVDLRDSNDSLVLYPDTHLDLVGDLDMGSGDSQSVTVGVGADLSVRAIKGSKVDLSISGTATLGGDPVRGVFDADAPAALKKGNTLSTYTGTTTINEGGILRAGQAWSLSSQSIHKVDGTLKLGDNQARDDNNGRDDQEIGELTGSGLVSLDNYYHLYYGGLNGDVQFSGTSEGNGSLVKEGDGTTTLTGSFGHTGFTKVHSGTLLIGADGILNSSSTVVLAGQGGTLDLGGTTQSVDNIQFWNGTQGTLKNGYLNTGTVEVQGAGFIENVGAVLEKIVVPDGVDIDQGSASLVVDGLGYGGYLTLSGDNHFKDIALTKGKILLDSGSLVLDGGVRASAYRDSMVLQGALTLGDGKTLNLAGGDDLFLIGAQGSLIAAQNELNITIDGGAGDLDIFWDASGNHYSLTESADGLFTESEESQLAGNVQNFELVGVAGQGFAYFGTKTSFATIQAEGSPPPGEYGLVLGSVGENTNAVDQRLTINNDYDSRTRNSLITTVGGIALGKGNSTILVPGGTLEAGIIYGQGDSSKNTIELGSAFTDAVKLGALSSVAKGRLDVGVLYGYDTIDQLGGLWSYNGRMDQTNLLAQGVVRVEADNSATLKSITARQRLQKINSPFGINGRSVIAVSGALTIGEGGIQEQGSARASLLVASRDGADAHVDLIGESNYSGPTIVARGGSLHAHTDGAMSSVSKTLVGKDGSILIEGSQAVNRLLIRKDGQFIGGGDSKLTTQSIVNRGDISLDSLVFEDGMTRFIDRYFNLKAAKGDSVPDDSRLRNIDAQGSLKNIGGSISVNGDLKFESTGDAGGHALLNLSTGGLRTKDISPASISANSIQFSEKNDVLINSGFVQTSGSSGINFGGGNDLVLSKGTFSIESGSKIDGGEPLNVANWKSDGTGSISGLNIFRSAENPGISESDLINWAAIKIGDRISDWVFPQGGECRVTGVGNSYSDDTFCVGLTGEKKDQYVRIESGATLDAGVISLGRGSSNSIEVLDGNLHAILIEGSPGQVAQASNDRLFLGNGEGGSGELIVGAITGFESMEQIGGTWSYAVNGVDDPQVNDRLIASGRRTAEELDEMGSFPAFTGYGIAKIAPVEITGRNKKQKTVQRAAFARIEGTNSKTLLQVQNIDSELEVSEGIHGNASLTTSGNTLLNGGSSYTGATTIQSGGELKAGNALALSASSEITIEPGGVLDLDGFANRILGLSGGSRAVSDPGIVKLGTNCSEDGVCDQELSGGILSLARGDFNGTIEDVPDSSGALIKVGSPDDVLTLGGVNQYLSSTLIQGGILKGGADQALSPNSVHSLSGGELDLRGYQQVLPSVNIDGGVLRVESDNPVTVAGNVNFADGRIVAYLNNGTAADGANAPISAQSFNYIPLSQKRDPNHGIYAIVDPAGTSNPELNGTWKVIDGEVNDIDALARKTFLIFPVTDGQEVDPDQVIEVNGVLYSVANFAGLNTQLEAASLKRIVLEKGSLNIVVKDKTKDEIIDQIKANQAEKFGCEGLEELCDGLAEPEVVDLLDLVLPVAGETDLSEKLPALQWGQLAKLLGSGLTPRNVDAAPRGMQTYNNVLVDTIFERHPLRQFNQFEENDQISIDQEVIDSTALDHDSFDPALEHVITFDGQQYVENPSLAAQYSERDGVRGWFHGFGANNRSYSSTTLNNAYSLYTGGFAIGADVSLSESFHLGAYANYGDVNVVQGGVTGGGSWNPDGWGGGLTADYLTENFYVQGLLGATGYSATQSRGIANLEEGWGGDTATANKNASSYLGALRIGAPFECGSLLLEPQFTGIWTQNRENSVSESGVRDGLRLRYGSRTTNYLQTGLGMKFSWPIDSGDRNQLVPSLKVAWLADWDLGNDGQSIGYKFTDREVKFEPQQETQNGALIEVGLDYTIANLNKMSVKLYANGGAELWGGERGTTWRGSGGVTFQF